MFGIFCISLKVFSCGIWICVFKSLVFSLGCRYDFGFIMEDIFKVGEKEEKRLVRGRGFREKGGS